ncbi:MAG: fliO [Herbaspirillum sp.]|nr:fliO [Herbaspirillum sp.]
MKSFVSSQWPAARRRRPTALRRAAGALALWALASAASAADAAADAATAKVVAASNAATAAASAENAAHAAAAVNTAAPSVGSSSLTMVFGLALVLALIAGVAWFMKRAGIGQHMHASAAAKVVGGVNVGTRERVVVVEVADTWIVVGVAPGRVSALATLPKQGGNHADAAATAAATPASKNFSWWMKHTSEKRNHSGS